MSTTRLYGAAIAVVSGIYSLAAPLIAAPITAMGASGWVMAIIGFVVLVHGIVLLTPFAHRLGRASGPLMIVWAAIMLANQAFLAARPSDPMGQPMMADMSWDPGMVAVAALMLVSGLIMTARRNEGSM